MVAPIRKENTNNVIMLSVINGKLSKKPEVKYNKDGSVNKSHSNKIAGVSSEVYPFTSEEEIKSIINVFDKRINEASNENKRMIARRDKMIFLIGINLGIRASDLCSLRYSFFMEDDGSFKDFYSLQPKKTRKQKKFVKLYFNDVVKKAISDYIKEYPVKNINGYIFKSRKGDGPITEKSLWRIIVEVTAEAGINKNVGSHTLRKTFGRFVWHF